MKKMDEKEILKNIKEAYIIAHDQNKNGKNTHYTYNEAIIYDPLVSLLYQTIKLLDDKNEK